MRLLSLVLLVTLSYVTAQQVCIQGGATPAECPNNYIWNSKACKFECEPHCVSNEGNFVFADPATGSQSFRQLCNRCTCTVGKAGAKVTGCTKMLCTSLCYDDDGKSYNQGETLTRGCKTATCTKVRGKGVWSWYNPATVTPKPFCPYGPATYNQDKCRWDCPTTCQDGSTPSDCLTRGCATVRCAFGQCVENYCPNFPDKKKGVCQPECKAPAQCYADPCKLRPGQAPKCGKNQVCEADYSRGCDYQCKDAPTCDFNGVAYQIGESRPSEDGCNTCGCTEHGWVCTLRACPEPTGNPPMCIQGGAPPAECPNNHIWNSKTCKFQCACLSNEGNVVAPGGIFLSACNQCTCHAGGNSTCTLMGCDFSKCYDDAGTQYDQGATIKRGCKTGTCTQGADGQGVWTWGDVQAPRCDLAPPTFDEATCKWSCPNTCANGSPTNCLVNPCAFTTCFPGTLCVANTCPNYPTTENGPCTATCQPATTVQCLVAPCSVNSCGNGQTCVDDYVGGCNYRCV